jgi:hypothetical protein
VWTFVSEQDSSHAKKLGLRCLGDNIKSPKLQFVQNPRKLRHHEKSGQRKNIRRAGSIVKQNERLILYSPITLSSSRFGSPLLQFDS